MPQSPPFEIQQFFLNKHFSDYSKPLVNFQSMKRLILTIFASVFMKGKIWGRLYSIIPGAPTSFRINQAQDDEVLDQVTGVEMINIAEIVSKYSIQHCIGIWWPRGSGETEMMPTPLCYYSP